MTHGACAPGVPRRPLHTDVLGRAAAARILNKVVRSVANMTLAMARERTTKKGSTDGRNDVISRSADLRSDAGPAGCAGRPYGGGRRGQPRLRRGRLDPARLRRARSRFAREPGRGRLRR